jgi:hypothetical protein
MDFAVKLIRDAAGQLTEAAWCYKCPVCRAEAMLPFPLPKLVDDHPSRTHPIVPCPRKCGWMLMDGFTFDPDNERE